MHKCKHDLMATVRKTFGMTLDEFILVMDFFEQVWQHLSFVKQPHLSDYQSTKG